MQTRELVKSLLDNANEIRRLFLQKIPLWKSEPHTYDKTRWGFVQGDNDGWYKGSTIELHFGAWCGTYGDSSTYKQITLDGEIFRKHFLNYLNSNKEKIMLTIADSIELEAKEHANKAKEELTKELNGLNELTVS